MTSAPPSPTPIPVLVAGALGRMGAEVVKAVSAGESEERFRLTFRTIAPTQSTSTVWKTGCLLKSTRASPG